MFIVVVWQKFWLFNYSISGYWLGTDRETCVWTGIQQPIPSWFTFVLSNNKSVRKIWSFVLKTAIVVLLLVKEIQPLPWQSENFGRVPLLRQSQFRGCNLVQWSKMQGFPAHNINQTLLSFVLFLIVLQISQQTVDNWMKWPLPV